MAYIDNNWKKLADTLVHYSLAVQPGEKVMIMMLELETAPLAEAVYTEVIKAGGYAQIQFMSESIKHNILRYGNPEQIAWVPEIEAYGMDWADCYLGLRGAFNLDECWDISDEKLAEYQRAMGVISTKRWEGTRWALVRVPNENLAHQARVSTDKIMDMFFKASTLDWEAYLEENQRIANILDQGHSLRILGDKTDLSFDFTGNWVVMDNKQNIPDGETYVTPLWNTVKGHIYFEFPATISGKLIHDLELRFEDSLVKELNSSTNMSFAKKIIFENENANRIGEVAFGTNPHIDIFSNDILLDEKMHGTMHIALGRPYDGSYYSPIHWDIIKDTRTNSKVYLDDALIFENGKFLI